jgi:LysR family transcriptional regulator (chromosome initiation inhibitor)
MDEQSLRNAPALAFNAKDDLQARWVKGLLGRSIATPNHWIPSSQAFIDAVIRGIGWGMNPMALITDHIADKRIVPLLPDRTLDVPLFWQWNRAVEPALRDVSASVIEAARSHLHQP